MLELGQLILVRRNEEARVTILEANTSVPFSRSVNPIKDPVFTEFINTLRKKCRYSSRVSLTSSWIMNITYKRPDLMESYEPVVIRETHKYYRLEVALQSIDTFTNNGSPRYKLRLVLDRIKTFKASLQLLCAGKLKGVDQSVLDSYLDYYITSIQFEVLDFLGAPKISKPKSYDPATVLKWTDQLHEWLPQVPV